MSLPIIPYPASVRENGGRCARGEIEPIRHIDQALGKEAYRLEIAQEEIHLTASQENGFFYAMQTLGQLRDADAGALPCCVIEDEPAFAHRGFMLDCVRHFFPVSDLKKLIAAAARMKLNVFHWHLCDDQGWRLPLDRYPEITEIGSVRAGSNFGRYHEEGPYGGCYTKEDIREIVAFCAENFIDVLPEVEMPGHASALLAAHPALSCTGRPVEVKVRGGVHGDVLCIGKEAVFQVVEDILAEVVALFPYSRVHIGGDEAPRDSWKACPSCQKRMREENLADEAQLQGYFMNRIAGFLKKFGKTAVVWNDALKGGNLDAGIEIQYWIGDQESAVRHVNQGGSMVMSDFFHYYLDYSYGQTPLDRVYEYNPMPEGIARQARSRMRGVEAPVWTEYMPTLDQVEYMCWPRLAAVAEAGWGTAQKGGAADFRSRLLRQKAWFDRKNIRMAPQPVWNMKKPGRIADALRFWYHAMTWADFREFIHHLKREKEEKKAQETVGSLQAHQTVDKRGE